MGMSASPMVVCGRGLSRVWCVAWAAAALRSAASLGAGG